MSPSAELAYAQSNGNGQIQILYDTNVPYAGLSTIWNHQRRITFNPNTLATYPPLVEQWIRYHEYGHHYLEHPHCIQDCLFAEASADAFAARCMYQTHGVAAVEYVITYTYNNPGDQVHRNGAQTYAYVQQIIAALQAGSEMAPPPPFPQCAPQVTGTLSLYNWTGEVAYLYLNQQLAGVLAPESSGSLALYPGSYSAYGFVPNPFGGTWYYFGLFAVELGGTTTNY